MKKIVLLALTALMVAGCSLNDRYQTEEYDNCEYVVNRVGGIKSHKGNCRFCKERRQKELEELIIKLKEK